MIESATQQKGVYFGHEKCDCGKSAMRYCELCGKLLCLDCYEIKLISLVDYDIVCLDCKK